MESYEEIENSPNFMTYNGNRLFHYTSFLSGLKIVSSKKLLWGDFRGMNDISESRREVFDEVSVDELNKCKAISFTEDKPGKRGFEIDSLWGYYAEKGNGVCLVFDRRILISSLKNGHYFQRHERIKYIRNFTNALFLSNDDGHVSKSIKKDYRNIFFTKSVDWRGENEYRFLMKSHQPETKEYLSFGNALKAVILCMPLSESIQDTCEYQILSKLTDVPILHYHTSLGNKTLSVVGGETLWPLLNVDYHLDI